MATDERLLYKSFWSNFSATNAGMLLNNGADDFEAHDRANIIESLPDFAGLDVVDVGAGIGRFTTLFAEGGGRSICAADFIESFIEENKRRNAHLSNISYHIKDAIGLELGPKSVDLVFTNWLLMYLSDGEVIEFLQNALRWLRPGGYIHLRESCSGPSTGVASSQSLHSSSDGKVNPTHYRFSSVYIQLFNAISCVDSEGIVWKLDVEWAKSVPTYIEVHSNWRQIHWLARKVRAEKEFAAGEGALSQSLLSNFGSEWPRVQLKADACIAGKGTFNWSNEILNTILDEESSLTMQPRARVLVLNPRPCLTFEYPSVNPHLLAEKLDCAVWCIETDPAYYRAGLTSANKLKDKRVRFAWSSSIAKALATWNQSMPKQFGGVYGIGVFSAIGCAQSAKQLAGLLLSESHVISIEPMSDSKSDEENRQALREKLGNVSPYFNVLSTTDIVSADWKHAWMRVHAVSIRNEKKHAEEEEVEFEGA